MSGPYGYPPGFGAPPPKRTNRALWWAVGCAVALVLVVVVVAGVVLVRTLSPDGAAAPSGRTIASGAPSDCGSPGASSTVPITDRVTAGPLSFPVSAAPGWVSQSSQGFSQGAFTVGLEKRLAGQNWAAHAEVGLTAFQPKVPARLAAQRIMACMVAESTYTDYRSRLDGLTQPEAIIVDGVPATRVTGRILVSRAGLAIPGDVVTVVVIDSAPQAYFESDTPIGDDALAVVARQVFEQLKVARDV